MNEQEASARQVDLLVSLLAKIVEKYEEDSREYHREIYDFLSQSDIKDLQTDKIVERLNVIADDKEREAGVRVIALASSLVYLWRRLDYRQFRKVFDKYRSTFQDADSSLESLYQGMYDLSRVSSPGGFQRALESAKEAKEALPNTPGALNLYTEVVAVIGERVRVEEGELEQAMLAIEEAIDIDPYAKYYANRARILAVQGNYDNSYQDIDKAIEREIFDDYTLWRVNSYEMIRSNIRLQQRLTEVKRQTDRATQLADQVEEDQEGAREQIAAMRGETLTLLGLLAAVIAFVVLSVHMVSSLQSVEAVILMTFMAGLILVVFGAFTELIQPDEKWRKKGKWVVGTGVAVVILAGLVLLGARLGLNDCNLCLDCYLCLRY